jgi:hypothetical protein
MMMKTLVSLMIALGASGAGHVRDDANGLVADHATGLQWQSGTGSAHDLMSWRSAVERCETMTLGGFSDWRLPNINELRSIVDASRSDPAIVPAFPDTAQSYYWTSTSYAAEPQSAWAVDFKVGSESIYNKEGRYFVRCVRGEGAE